MVTLLDTDRLPVAERRPDQVSARLEATMASSIRLTGAGLPVRARLDGWDLGGLSVLRADVSGFVALGRSARRAREDTAPTVSLVIQELGQARQDQPGGQRIVPRGGLALTEISSPYQYRWSGRGMCWALQVPVSRIGLPVDALRRALPLAHRSPLYALVRNHLTQVTHEVEQLSREPVVVSVASATIDLIRALLASAAGPGRAMDDVVAETMLSQVRSYVRQHLTEPELDVGQIAAAHAISVRQLYRLCSAAQFSLEQWIIQQRLEGARGELCAPGSQDRSIAMVARRWGFTDPSYFSRRFLRAFGVTPRDWRRLDPAAVPRSAVPG
jgi:AraC-like DNA-binding protein